MKIEGSMEEMISNLFQNCDEYFEDVNENGYLDWALKDEH